MGCDIYFLKTLKMKKMLIIIWVVHNLTLMLEKYIKTLFNEILTIAITKKLSFWEKGYW